MSDTLLQTKASLREMSEPIAFPEPASLKPASLQTYHDGSTSSTATSSTITLWEPSHQLEKGDVEANWSTTRLPTRSTKRRHEVVPKLRYNYMSVYKRLFYLYVLANTVAIIAYTCLRRYPSLAHVSNMSTPIAVNLLVATLTRTECVVNLFFRAALLIPLSTSLRLRRIFAKIYEYGGFHSGAGASTGLWILVLTVQGTRGFIMHEVGLNVVAFIYALGLLTITSIVVSLPPFRAQLHDYFEAFHRFSAWLSLILFWALTGVLTNTLCHRLNQSTATVLLGNPSFWMLLVITFFVILPWARLRRISARPERLSSHAIRMHFTHRSVTPSQALKISTSPLFEWHTFATIPSRDEKSFSIIISNAGDWTSHNIANPRTSYWTRGVPTTGMARVIQLFRKVVIVTTGSGIAPVISNLISAQIAGDAVKCRLIWSTRDPLETYSQEILDEVKRADSDAIIINSKKNKTLKPEEKPDLSAIAYRAYTEYEAEAVIIVSNPYVTYKVKYDMECRGVPAFSPIFDS